jgi:hypothetical protein
MKKLLMKLFPSYFTVNTTKVINFEDMEPSNNLHLQMVTDETDNTLEALGITDERADVLIREVKKAILDSTCKISVMQKMEKHITHINEFYIVALMVQRETEMLSGGGMHPLMQLLSGMRPPGGGPDTEE